MADVSSSENTSQQVSKHLLFIYYKFFFLPKSMFLPPVGPAALSFVDHPQHLHCKSKVSIQVVYVI